MSYQSRSPRNHFGPPLSPFERLLAALPYELGPFFQQLFERQRYLHSNALHGSRNTPLNWPFLTRHLKLWSLLNLPNFCILVWVVVLLWGERWIFESSVKACEWKNWEPWPNEATPHHLIFLADPQLIDPHTYPGRPWPLSTLTVKHTDNYLLRSYIQLQKSLHPDTLFFLGDLFDGGREWTTRQGDSEDPEWAKDLRPASEKAELDIWRKKYGENFWLREYDRFGKIFFKHWNDGGALPGKGQRGRKLIAGLPGNHDLGFGAQIKIPVRDRFQAYFGETNRVDVIGNHTFVSIDAVSLSAGSSTQQDANTRAIYKQVDDFLKGVQPVKRKAIARELSYMTGDGEALFLDHNVEPLDDTNLKNPPNFDPGADHPVLSNFPTILLTHVPLYRPPGTPCGPFREHWPPSPPPVGQTTPVNHDPRNAISVSGGYQYQNVLTEQDSTRLIESIGDVKAVFSGDDHDYCEVVHPAHMNNAREITVKSCSWAMGVRRPGFVMVSLWNPVFGDEKDPESKQQTPTIQTHLCLLPDQIGILLRYAWLIALSILILTTRAVLTPVLNLEPFAPFPASSPYHSEMNCHHHSKFTSSSLLPIHRSRTYSTDSKALYSTSLTFAAEDEKSASPSHSSTSSTVSAAANGNANGYGAYGNENGNLAPRSAASRTRSVSPGVGVGGMNGNGNGSSIGNGTGAGGYGLPANQVRVPVVARQEEERSGWGETLLSEKETYYHENTGGVGVGGRKRVRFAASKARIVGREVIWGVWRVAWAVLGVYVYLWRFG